MKKVLLATVILTGSMAFISCKKDYTCECKTDAYVLNVITISTTTSTTIHDTKKNAEEQCGTGSTSVIFMGTGATTECVIK